MAEQLAINVAENAVESLISRIWKEIHYLFDYNENIENLGEKVEDLEDKRGTVKLLIDEAERNAEIIGSDVLEWMKKVDKTTKEANKILEHTKNTQWGCLYCKCPKLHSRYKLSKQAWGKTSKVIELQEASKFERIGYPLPAGQMPIASPQEFDGFESRAAVWNGVMEALRDNSTTIIGICGMAGVGKTTLVKEIADKVKDEKLFDEVTVAVVSKDPVVAKIQDQLAENLGLKIEEKSDHRRAERLYTRLMNEDKRILLILDDLWQELHFHYVGIPVQSKRDGLKVMLTSRYKKVCSDMRATTFEVEVLSEEESWHLFKRAAEISEEANDIKAIAKDVANECGGLPLAIVTIGKALKNRKAYAWREALKQLKEDSVSSIRGMQDLVYKRIKLSYEYLENDNSMSLLLLCSLFPEDYNIPLENLVRFAKGLHLFQNVGTMGRVRDKVYSITDELKNCYLLLQGDHEDCVKLHDVVRDVLLSIVSSDEHKFMVRHVGLNDWPQEDSYTPYTAISLAIDEVDELPSGLKCPNLKLLQLNFQGNKLHIHRDFFKEMNELKVLGFFYLNSELLPSLQSLVNLRTLCLDSCRLYGGISIIGSLRKLEVLSFYNSYLDCFPEEIVELINLKCLDLRFKKGPPLPSSVLLSLKKLEELYLGSYFQEWKRKGVESYYRIITEISSLQNLQTIEFCTYDDHCLEQVLENLHHKKLTRFKISRTTYDEGIKDFQFRKVLTLLSVNVDVLLKPTVQTLLWETEDLTLMVEGLTNIVNDLDVKGFVNLKKLNMLDCDVKYLIDANNFLQGGGTFINLEELVIENANKLQELCRGNLPLGSFARLREMQLLRCPMLETLVCSDRDEKDTRDIEFPQLKIIELYQLKCFRSLSSKWDHGALFRKAMLPNLKTMTGSYLHGIRCIVDDQVPVGSLSRLQTIEVYNSDGLRHIAASNSIKLLRSLERLHVGLAESLEVIFDFTGLVIKGANMESLLDRLQSLRLHELPKLKRICRMFPKEIHAFKNLRSLHVRRCGNLRYLLSPFLAKMFVGLEVLELAYCKAMEAMIGRDERLIPETEIESEENIVNKRDGEESTRKIQFPKLRRLEIVSLENLQMLCCESVDLEFPSLTQLVIEDCPKMTKLCVGQLSATKVHEVQVKHFRYDDCKSVEENVALVDFNSWLKDSDSKIRCLECSIFREERCRHFG